MFCRRMVLHKLYVVTEKQTIISLFSMILHQIVHHYMMQHCNKLCNHFTCVFFFSAAILDFFIIGERVKMLFDTRKKIPIKIVIDFFLINCQLDLNWIVLKNYKRLPISVFLPMINVNSIQQFSCLYNKKNL